MKDEVYIIDLIKDLEYFMDIIEFDWRPGSEMEWRWRWRWSGVGDGSEMEWSWRWIGDGVELEME
jgi:hypothetical protein